MQETPNIVVIMTDQQRADVSAREGFELDTTPFLDQLAYQGSWFDRAYTSLPICAPARESFLTGRYPSATGVQDNSTIEHAKFETDLFEVMTEQGYATALCGKNHSHLTPERVDHWFTLTHRGGSGTGRTPEEREFDEWMDRLNHGISLEPTPFPVECQSPYRAVSDAQSWLQSLDDEPFFLWLSFPEPHNPYQVPEPYYSMFPAKDLPPLRADEGNLEQKGFKWQWMRQIAEDANPNSDFDELLPRVRSNYYGMLRLIDDQVKRFTGFLEAEGLQEDTLLVFVSDHGDYVCEYGLLRKGPDLPEVLTRVPLFFVGSGVTARREPHPAHVSIVDLMPTLCEVVGAPLPDGTVGRSLWPLLTDDDYPAAEFESIYAEAGVGGLHYTEEDDPDIEDCLIHGPEGTVFDSVNYVSVSGRMCMIRKGDWKLVLDMQGHGQLYNLAEDSVELDNCYGKATVADKQMELLEELLAWRLRAQDPLPTPEGSERNTDPRNYWAPYR